MYDGSDLDSTLFPLPYSTPKLSVPRFKVSSQDLGRRGKV